MGRALLGIVITTSSSMFSFVTIHVFANSAHLIVIRGNGKKLQQLVKVNEFDVDVKFVLNPIIIEILEDDNKVKLFVELVIVKMLLLLFNVIFH